MINAHNYDTISATNDSFFVLVDEKGRYFARDFEEPSTEHAMFCTNDVREATRYASKDDAEKARESIMSWHTSQDHPNNLAKEIVKDSKPLQIFHREVFEVPKGVMVRSAGLQPFANLMNDVFGGK